MIDVEALIGIVRRQWMVVVAAVAAAIFLGFVYIITATPLYTSSVNVLIDRGNGQLAQELSAINSGGVVEDDASILSQVEIFKSDTIALAVVDKLDLLNDAEFQSSPSSLVGSITGGIRAILNVSNWFSSDDSETSAADIEAKKQAAADRLLANLEVARVGRTYVLAVEYTSPSAALSSKIANGFGDAYLLDKLNSKYEATRRASVWLQDRIAELRQKSVDSDLAVQKFRTAHGLVSTGSVLVSDQQLQELNSALISAQSDSAKAQARLERIQQIIASGQGDAIVTDVLGSSVSNQLREKYLEASKLQSQITARLGPDHVQAVRLRNEMAEYERLMFEELRRIAESYKSDLDVARAREKGLADNVAQATGVSASANETQVQLRELERESETYKNLYQTFLQRHQEAIQQQSFPVTEARVITRAVPSKGPSHPRKSLILALFVFMGGAVGAGIGGFREFRDRFFRTGDHVREGLDLEFLGIAPLIEPGRMSAEELRPPGPSEIWKTNTVSNYIIDNPLSAFAETLRSTKLAADMALANKQTKVIGFVSSLPGEGKSTTAVNFAELLAIQGNRTVVIDGDLRNPGLTRAIGRHAQAGLLESLMQNIDPRTLLMRNPRTGLALLPAVITHRVPHSSELLGSAAMRNVLAALATQADYIVIDLPPIGPVVDARAIAGRIDGFVFVTEWGQTARRVARQLISNEPEIREKCLGVILNKVDQEKMKLYRQYGSEEYYHSQYSKYYQDNK